MPLLAPIAAAIIEGLLWLFKSRIGLFIVSALVWLGINWTTLNIVLGPTIDLLKAIANGIGATGSGDFAAHAAAWMGVMNFDKALTMIISAYITRETMMRGRLFLFKKGVGA